LCNLIGDTADFASKGWLEPIDNRLASWQNTGQIWPKLWDAVTYKGKRYGIPWYTDCRLLMYNYDLFENAGLDPKKPPTTWDELRDDAIKMTDVKNGIYGYGVSGTSSLITTCAYYVFVLSNGGKVLSDDYKTSLINSKEAVEALKAYTDLYTKYKVSPPGTLSMGEDEYRTLMAQGKIAMAIGGPWSIPLIENANPNIKGRYGFAPHPHAAGKESGTFFGGWYFAIPSKSQSKDMAWNFLTHVTSYDTWMYWAGRFGGPLPTRKDVFNDAAVFKTGQWPTIIEGFKGAHSVEPIVPIFKIWTEIYTMIQQVLLGELSADDAANKYNTRVQQILDQQQ
jgi:multiple sugar transport system substrate-binding protein